jgi:DNA-binding Lrp family transcriptional regulator
MAFIGVEVNVSEARGVAERIADLAAGTAVMITMGRFNVLAICLFNSLDSLLELASDQILSMPGVHHVETTIAVKTVKYNARVVRITDADRARLDVADDDA